MRHDAPLVIVRQPGRSPLYVLVAEAIEVGRGGAGILLDDPEASRRHLELRPGPGGDLVVVDLGSANGTLVNDEIATGPTSVPPGSTIRLGDTTIERLDGPSVAPASGEPEVTYTSIERVAEQAAQERVASPSPDWSEGTVTIAFSDIESSTELAQRLGDARWMEILAEHNAIVRASVRAEAGSEVKSQGDGFMLAFPSARHALRAMIGVQQGVAQMAASEPDRAIRVRFGAHTGEVIVGDDGDLYGHHVNVAARIAGQAAGGEILVSSIVKEIAEARGDLRFGEPRTATLKGLGGVWRLHPVLWEGN